MMCCKMVEQLFPSQGGSCSVAAAEDKNEYYVKILKYQNIKISKYYVLQDGGDAISFSSCAKAAAGELLACNMLKY